MHCPHCSSPVSYDPSLENQPVICPRCQRQFPMTLPVKYAIRSAPSSTRKRKSADAILWIVMCNLGVTAIATSLLVVQEFRAQRASRQVEEARREIDQAYGQLLKQLDKFGK